MPIDFYGGSRSISGSSRFKVDHSPLDQLTQLTGPVETPDIGELIFDPWQSLLEMIFQNSGINIENAASLFASILDNIKEFIENLFEFGVDFDINKILDAVFEKIKENTGLDLTGITEFFETIREKIKEVFGIDFSTPQTFFQSLGHMWDDILEAIKDLTQISFAGPQALFNSIEHLLTNIGITIQQVLDVIGNILHLPPALNTSLDNLTDWALETIFGIVLPERVPVLPIAHLTNNQVNLLTNPMFTGDPFMPQNQGEWILDLSTSQNGIGGSARIDANSTQHDLLSVDLIPVKPGQKFEVAAWIKTKDLVAAAGSVIIGVAEYADAEGSAEPIYRTLTKPTQVGTTDWKLWGGTYTVPPDGVEALRVHLEVGVGATSGQVWIDNLFAGKKGLIALNWVEGLQDRINDLWDGIEGLVIKIAEFLRIDEIVAWFEKLTGLNINEGPAAFIQSLIEKIRIRHGIDLSSPSALFLSIRDLFNGLVHTLQEIVAHFEEKTGLNINQGPIRFIQSVFDKIRPLFDGIVHTLNEIVYHFEEKTGLNIDEGPIKFTESLFQSIEAKIRALIQAIAATLQQVIDYLESRTGLEIDQGPVKFLQSLIARIRDLPNGVDLTSNLTVFNGLRTQIENLIKSIAATLQQMIDHFELQTGLNIDAGPAEFIKSVIEKIKNRPDGVDLTNHTTLLGGLRPKLSAAAVPEGWQGFLDKVGGKTSATDQTLADRLQHLNATGLFNATRLNGLVPNTQVTGITVGGTVFPNLGDAAQTAHANMQATWDEWMSALTGQTATTGTAPLTAGQIKELMATVVANATAIAQLQAETQASGGGMSGGDEFERPASATVDGWAVTTSDATGSTFALDGHEAYWVERGKTTTVRYRRTDPKDALTKTAYQSITRVNGTRVLQYGLAGNSGTDTVFGRMSADGTRYIVAEVDNDSVTLRYNVGAGELPLKTEPLTSKPAAGTRLTLECGTSASINNYRVLRNGQIILTHADTTKVTAPLDANRGWGWGGKSFKPALVSELAPSSVNAVTVFDNLPPTVVGTHLRVYRGTTVVVASPDGDRYLPNSTFDFSENPSPDLGWDVATQTVTITEPGPYNFNIRLEFSKEINSVDRWELLLYRKKANEASFPPVGVPTLRGASQSGANGSNARSIAGSFSVYLEPGDQVRLGISTSVTPLVPDVQIIGDTAGSRTWMTVTKGA